MLYTALIVEDEDMIREIAVQTLEDDGFAFLKRNMLRRR